MTTLFDPTPVSSIDPHACAIDVPPPSTTVAALSETLPPLCVTSTEIPWAEEGSIDWSVITEMRGVASRRLSSRLGSDTVDINHQHHIGQLIIAELLKEYTSQALTVGKIPWSPGYQTRMGQALFDSLFRLGRLQTLVDDDTIENVIICGADNVWIEDCSGALTRGQPVADTDEDLIDFLSFIASRSEVNERSFSPSEPRLHLRLDSGARLAAVAWVTPRPSVVIRRHRLSNITLETLVAGGTLSAQAASFLSEAVRRGASIVVSGAQGAGKTTMMRALCNEIPAHEMIGTFETEYELHLHEMPARHPIVHAWEARPGSGEKDSVGHRAGEFTLDEALYDSFRFNLSRQIVGEVRGKEILAMLKAMQSGSGSLSTTHAHSAEGAIRKLITCAMEAGPHITSEYATRAVGEDLDFIVHMELSTTPTQGGSVRHRWVKEILSVHASDSASGYSTTRVFSAAQGQQVAQLVCLPPQYARSESPIHTGGLPWP
ncbi:MAG: CpaF/VirB11 family protein [Propionibacteriaceae bacterium]|nr:CpaF/VirB11 family protein [Propionibacteriaceae bacterium]